ncbi:unnamed protein product [Ilex paraguariensis]|uniref:Uncharacterized protein n=1 Tax=Ilex paraguariensis TaxID=185542 RepID=A0ABC8T5J1_9AQUA
MRALVVEKSTHLWQDNGHPHHFLLLIWSPSIVDSSPLPKLTLALVEILGSAPKGPLAQAYLLSLTNSQDELYLVAEMTLKQVENFSPPIMKQVLPLVEQLPPLYMELVNGREYFTPKPEETRRLVCQFSYCDYA